MNERIEGIIQDIGYELMDWLGDDLQDALVLADCADGVSAVGVVFRDTRSGKLVLKFPPDELDDLVYSLWEEWPADQGKWRAAEYVLRKGKFELNLIYPEDYDEDALSSDIREQAVKKYFGDEPVDESDPD